MMNGYTYECPLRGSCSHEYQKQLCDDEDYAMCIIFDDMEEELMKHGQEQRVTYETRLDNW